jgi:ribosomal-protein-alanine N-acetyltransferase
MIADLVARPLQLEDLPDVLSNERNGYSFPWSEQSMRSCLDGGYRCWVGLQRGKIVCHGITSLVIDEGHLLNLCVGCRWQGQGLGFAMLNFLITDLETRQASVIFLEVRESNHAARALYAKNRFQVVGIRKGYYPNGGGREDALVMRKLLAEA